MLRPWLLAARPKTLAAAVVPVLVGTAMAASGPRMIDWWLFACTLAGALLIQIGTNFVNDALDFKKGADTAERLGPLRVTQAGLLSADAVMRGAYVCLFLAALCGVPLVIHAGWPLLTIGLASIAAAYAYTGGPYPLAYHGLGELFVLSFFGLAAVGGTYYIQRGTLDWTVWAMGVATGLLAVALLAINNLRDAKNDVRSGKHTMAVRFGETFARIEIVISVLAPFAIVATIAALRSRPWLMTIWIALPLAIALLVRVYRSEGSALNRCLAMCGALQWAFGIVFSVSAIGLGYSLSTL
jgi:1,4-dihydroxy-2-naphthoate polyprenyltransferase